MIIDNGKIRFSVGAEWSDRSSYFFRHDGTSIAASYLYLGADVTPSDAARGRRTEVLRRISSLLGGPEVEEATQELPFANTQATVFAFRADGRAFVHQAIAIARCAPEERIEILFSFAKPRGRSPQQALVPDAVVSLLATAHQADQPPAAPRAARHVDRLIGRFGVFVSRNMSVPNSFAFERLESNAKLTVEIDPRNGFGAAGFDMTGLFDTGDELHVEPAPAQPLATTAGLTGESRTFGVERARTGFAVRGVTLEQPSQSLHVVREGWLAIDPESQVRLVGCAPAANARLLDSAWQGVLDSLRTS